MATPTKDLTYLDGLHLRMERSPVQPAMAMKLRAAPVERLVPPFWKPLYYLEIKPRMDITSVQGPLDPKLLAAPVLTLFWRKKQYRPLRGQLWPLTR